MSRISEFASGRSILMTLDEIVLLCKRHLGSKGFLKIFRIIGVTPYSTFNLDFLLIIDNSGTDNCVLMNLRDITD